MRRRRWLGWGGALAVLAAALAFGLAGKRSGTGPAPALPRAALAGPAVTLAELRGRPAVVVFWASWCTPCGKEAPAFARFYAGLAGRAGLVGVDVEDDRAAARDFVRRNGWRFPSLFDPEGAVYRRYGSIGLPVTVVLDARGRVHETLRGPQTWQSLERALASVARA
ncbi:MAG TPA: TlpA disulfide reductase family protein [Solirubrobacteraceae bacterium]